MHHQRLLGAAVLWLLGGSALLLTTLIPAHTELLGWTPAFWLIGAPLVTLLASRLVPMYSALLGWSGAFWLLGAPLVMLLALEPGLPRRMLSLRIARRRARDAVWN
jgi:hypothetical protein